MWVGLGLGGIAVIGVIIGIVAVRQGRLYIGFKKPDENVTISQRVCSREVIERFTGIWSVGLVTDTDGARTLRDDIRGLDNYDADPNCVWILMQASVVLGDVDAVKVYADQYVIFDNRGLFAQHTVESMGVSPEHAVFDAELFQSGEILKNRIGS